MSDSGARPTVSTPAAWSSTNSWPSPGPRWTTSSALPDSRSNCVPDPTALIGPEPVPGPAEMIDVMEPVCSRLSNASADSGTPHAPAEAVVGGTLVPAAGTGHRRQA